MAEAMIFHYREDDNFLVHFNPAAKLIALLSYSVIVSSASSRVVFVLALLPIVAASAIHLPWRQYLKESAFFIVLAAIMCAASYASDHDAVESAASAVAFLSMVLSSILLMDTTMPDELSRSLGSALRCGIDCSLPKPRSHSEKASASSALDRRRESVWNGGLEERGEHGRGQRS